MTQFLRLCTPLRGKKAGGADECVYCSIQFETESCLLTGKPFVVVEFLRRMQAGYWRQDAGGVELARLRGAVARAQERSRGGRWSWALIAGGLSCCWQRPGEIKRREVELGSHSGWIVLLLAEPRRDQEEGGEAGLSLPGGLCYC